MFFTHTNSKFLISVSLAYVHIHVCTYTCMFVAAKHCACEYRNYEYVHVTRVRVQTCITAMCNADILRVTLQEMRHDHVDVLVLLFSPAAHKAEVITASYRL